MLFSLREAHDYVVVLTAVSTLENAISAGIVDKLTNKSDLLLKNLFEGPNAPIGSLSAKNSIAFALGVYGARARGDIDSLRNVRNAFAHLNQEIELSEQKIDKQIRSLGILKEKFTEETLMDLPTKQLLILAVFHLANGAVAQSIWPLADPLP